MGSQSVGHNWVTPTFTFLCTSSILKPMLRKRNGYCQDMSVMSNSVRPHSCPPGSPPGSPVPGILQARTLEWVAISFSNAWKWKVKVKLLSRVRLFVTPWTAAYQAPPSMGFPRQEYWSRLPLPSPRKRKTREISWLEWVKQSSDWILAWLLS